MGTLVFQANLGGAVNLIGPNTASTVNFTLPSADGTSGQALVTNGSGTLSFSTFTSGAAGSNTQVQFNSSGAFAGSSNLTFNGTTLTAANTSITTSETLSYGTANGVAYLNGSKVVTTGSALTFDGTNLGVGGSASRQFQVINASNAIVSVLNGTTEGVFNAVASTVNIGTVGAIPLLFSINGSEQMRLTSTGLGIGTSSPATKLDTAGTMRSTGNTTPSSGAGLELLYDSGNTRGIVQVYDRTGAAYRQLALDGSSVLMRIAGTTQATLDSSGNLGLGVTPSAWSGAKAIEAGLVGNYFIGSTAASYTSIGTAAYYNGTNWIYARSTGSAKYELLNNTHAWSTAASGTAGNAITFTQAMTLGADGLLQIGMTGGNVADGKLNVAATGTGAGTANTRLFMAGYEETSGNKAGLWFGARTNENTGVIGSRTASGNIAFETYNNSSWGERARIDSSGNLLVGATSGTGRLYVESSGNNIVGRFYGPGLTDSNTTVYFDKPSTTTTTSQVFVAFTVNAKTTGCGQINANGASQAAFGSFSDKRLKENIVDLPSQLSNIMALRPVEFDYIESEGGGHQTGFIAQEFEQVYPDAIGERADGMKTLTGWGKTEARLVKAIQELKAEFDAYKATHP